MGEPATAMRDPIFYRYHAFVDDVFLEHKNTLPEYSLQQVGVHSCPASSIYHRFTLAYNAAKYTYYVAPNYAASAAIKTSVKAFNPARPLDVGIYQSFCRHNGNLAKY